MSDAPQGPGWWQASDGKWYPPEQNPNAGPPPGGGPPPGYGAPAPAGGGNLDIGAAISYGFNKFIANIGPLLILLLIIIGVQVVFSFVAFGIDSFFVRSLVYAIGYVISLTISMGLIRAALAIVEGRPIDPAQLFNTDRLGDYFIASLIVGLCYIIPCVGLVAGFFFFFYGYFVIDQNMSGTDALGASFNMVKDNVGTLIAFLIVTILIALCTCGLGWPVAWIAGAYAYKTLNGQPVAP
jgi:hypothetical protein